MIEGISFENIRKSSLIQIWYESKSFNAFRGEEWMPETCRSCDMRHEDGGGCRCQAFALTGDVTATDPACQLAPQHSIIEKSVQVANSHSEKTSSLFIYRNYLQHLK